MTMFSVNPQSGEQFAEFETWDDETLSEVILQASYEFEDWSKLTPLADRCLLLKRMADVLRDDQELLAELITLEMGKLFTESMAEIEKCAVLCDYYAENAQIHLADEV
ncbi:MAG TPA: succinate-semialdehyde dehydrogenase, partial [Thiomicrospira sp.]|nr:succinate-semialdehyde dehydrogenase [Thiomicrospira sp.]